MKIKTNLKNKNQGFTIIESVVVMCIIGILAVTAALGYGEITRQKTLEKASQRVASSLSQARDYSVFGKEIDGKFPCGYGILLDKKASDLNNKKVTFIYTNKTSIGENLDRTGVMGLSDNVTCDDLISSKSITLSEYSEDTTWFTAASDIADPSKEHISVADIKKGSNNISSDCLILIFSSPRGGSYYCDTSCSLSTACQFKKFSDSDDTDPNKYFLKLSVTDGVVIRDRTLKIYSSGNIIQQ